MTFSVGQTIGGYEILGVVGRSGFGVAYKVRYLSENRIESLKVLPADLRGSQSVDHFRREIKIHGRLNHPNIIRFFRSHEIEGHLAIATELAEGISLEQRLREKRLSLKEGIGYLSDTLDGLACAHEHGVVHRCIHPGNLIIGADNRVKITGFSFAKSALDPRLTLRGFVIGVADYMAPEQVASELSLDGRADVYAVGAVLYEMATGKPPFRSNSVFKTMQAHLHKAPRRPSEMNQDLPAELDEIILTALAKDRSNRFTSAREFRGALQSVKPALEAVAV
jgi:serine/threonine-protein kinase